MTASNSFFFSIQGYYKTDTINVLQKPKYYSCITNVQSVSLLSHNRYQYDNPISSKHTGACPCEHSNSCYDALLYIIYNVEQQKLSLNYPHKKKITRH